MVPNKLSTDQPFDIAIQIRNYGQSTAMLVENQSHVLFEELPDLPQYAKPTYEAVYIMPPNATRQLTFPVIDLQRNSFRLNAKQLQDIRANKIVMSVLGYLEYGDVMENLLGRRKTGFCFQYNPKQDGLPTAFQACRNLHYSYLK